MNKKILIGSIIAVSVIIGISFTGVVGFQSVKSDIKASPLFNIRTQRAVDRDSKDIVCDYVGKGEPTFVTIPKRINKLEIVQKVLDIISKTDDKIFNVYLNMLNNQIQKNDKYDDVNINEVITAIHQLRGNPDRINLNAYKNSDTTWRNEFIPTLCWFPGCNIFLILDMFIGIIEDIFIAILGWITSQTCMGYTFGACCPD